MIEQRGEGAAPQSARDEGVSVGGDDFYLVQAGGGLRVEGFPFGFELELDPGHSAMLRLLVSGAK